MPQIGLLNWHNKNQWTQNEASFFILNAFQVIDKKQKRVVSIYPIHGWWLPQFPTPSSLSLPYQLCCQASSLASKSIFQETETRHIASISYETWSICRWIFKYNSLYLYLNTYNMWYIYNHRYIHWALEWHWFIFTLECIELCSINWDSASLSQGLSYFLQHLAVQPAKNLPVRPGFTNGMCS